MKAVLLLLLGSLACVATAADECELYLAPSTISGDDAGFGVFAGVDFDEGETVGEPDLIIPVIDEFKTLPYRGQQQFLSWLGYVWPAEPDTFYKATKASFPIIPEAFYKVDPGLNGATSLKFRNPETKERISAFAPGIASMVNSDSTYVNIKSVKRKNQVSFVTRDDLEAGTELFLHYGEEWHKRYNKRLRSETMYDTLEDYNENILPDLKLPTEQDKRNKLDKKPRKKLQVDDDDEFDETDITTTGQYDSVNQFRKYIDKVLHKRPTQDALMEEVETSDSNEEEEEYDDEEYDEDHVPMRDIEWLKKNGMCIDNLHIGSSKKRGAARSQMKGAFTNNAIRQGERIAPAPLLAIKREDLNIYKADETQKAFRNVLNFEKLVGQEQLLNYCFGDVDSELLLLPYSPVVNYINHGGQKPNAEIRWPKDAPNDWLDLHPLDVLELSGKIMMEYVALRDILPGEEIVIDFGQDWDEAWNKHRQENGDMNEFRHEIRVPDGFFPDTWKNQPVVYELAKKPLKAGELELMTWKHNGDTVCKNCFRVGLPSGFSQHFRDFAGKRGIINLYEKLLNNPILDNNEWTVFDTMDEQWFAQQYEKKAWNFNMHYIAAWDEAARMSFLRDGLGRGGFDVVLESLGTQYGLDNMTCFHLSFMGISDCDNSFTHADVYANDEKGFNIIWPMIVVEGSSPELDIISDDTNIVISVNYEYDVAYVMGDWGYHKTSPNSYEEKGEMRVVVGAYCSQIDKTNAKMMKYIYNGENPAPFIDQFENPEVHWSKNGGSLPK